MFLKDGFRTRNHWGGVGVSRTLALGFAILQMLCLNLHGETKPLRRPLCDSCCQNPLDSVPGFTIIKKMNINLEREESLQFLDHFFQ